MCAPFSLSGRAPATRPDVATRVPAPTASSSPCLERQTRRVRCRHKPRFSARPSVPLLGHRRMSVRTVRSTAKSGQYACCAVRCEAVFGELPFDSPWPALRRPRVEPRATSVPSWLRSAVLRGLRINPEEWYPSMAALLDALAMALAEGKNDLLRACDLALQRDAYQKSGRGRRDRRNLARIQAWLDRYGSPANRTIAREDATAVYLTRPIGKSALAFRSA